MVFEISNIAKIFLKIFRQIIFYGSILLLWQGLVYLKIWPFYIFPSPGQVGEVLWEDFKSGGLVETVGVT